MRRELWPILAGSILGVALGLRLGKKKATVNPPTEIEGNPSLCTPVPLAPPANTTELITASELEEDLNADTIEALSQIFLRSEPALNADTIGTIPQGERMELLEEVAGKGWGENVVWGKVRVDDRVGYIYDYMRFTHRAMKPLGMTKKRVKTLINLQA